MKAFLFVLSLLLPAGMVAAQPGISLTEADYSRLGIEFASVSQASRGSGERFPATVISSPDRASAVIARHAGQVERWLSLPGETVSAGEALVLLRSNDILALQNDWLAAVTRLEQARFERDKDERLFSEGVIAETRLMSTRRRYQEASQQEQGFREALHQAGLNDTDLEALRNGEGLGRYTLRAPYDATLTRHNAMTGEFVEAHTTVAMVSDGRHWIRASLPVRATAMLETGQSLSLADRPVELRLRQKDSAVDPDNQTVNILAEVMAESPLVPGQIVTLVVSSQRDGVLVPASAIVRFDDNTVVYVEAEGGVDARQLELYPVGDDYLVETGLTAGERVVVRGAAILKGMQLGLGGE